MKREITNQENLSDIFLEAGRIDKHYWKDIWRYKELIFLLVWRDVLVRYKQTVFGVAWAVIRPLVTMIVFTIVFGKIASLPSNGVPYPLLVFGGILVWQFFSTAFADAANSVIGNANMISKVYFPRIIVPLSVIVVSLIDFAITLVVFAGLSVWYAFLPDWRILFLPFFIGMLFFFTLSVSLWFAALNVRYRDFRYILPFILQLGAYASPVGFSSDIVPEKWRVIYALNPLVGIIDGFRWSLLSGTSQLNFVNTLVAIFVTLILLITGVRFFKRQERQFADVI